MMAADDPRDDVVIAQVAQGDVAQGDAPVCGGGSGASDDGSSGCSSSMSDDESGGPQKHELARDARCTVVSVDALSKDFACPVCLEPMREVTATECLHRFCADCIEKSLRYGYVQSRAHPTLKSHHARARSTA